MLLTIWISIFLLFWVAYYFLTKGRMNHHLGFLHYLIYFYLIYAGALTIYLNEGGLNNWYIANVLLYPVLSMLGMIFAAFFVGRSYSEEVTEPARPRDIKLTIGTIVVFLIVYAVYLQMTEMMSPLKVLFSSGNREIAYLARFLVTKGYKDVNIPGFFVWFPRIFVNYFSCFVAIFFYYHFRKKSLKSNLKFMLLFAGLLLIALETTQKYPTLRICVIFALCLYNVKYPKITLKSVGSALAAGVIVVFLAGSVYSLVAGMFGTYYDDYLGRGLLRDMGTILEFGFLMLKNRTIEAENFNLFMTYIMIPDFQNFFHGVTLDNPRTILPYEHVSWPYMLFNFYNSAPPGTQGSAPTVFFGEIYANFGHLVAWLSMFGFGFIIQILNSKLVADIKKFQTPFYLAFFYLIMVYISDFSQSLSVPYFDPTVWFFFLFYILSKKIILDPNKRSAVWVQ